MVARVYVTANKGEECTMIWWPWVVKREKWSECTYNNIEGQLYNYYVKKRFSDGINVVLISSLEEGGKLVVCNLIYWPN